ncbi:restriction endonuclease subunit S [Flavobacterium sp. LS1R49]|uniref:Restriction endonuclease subunit S n=1 Tax=Flavobacterium shii TaxID=2987687 RepID=A0A9X2YV13_9FLAO|nr:restriction endonuclease subunit S [Flavobacterium shii]MCV9928053.1 restriction endonuclease subunit S [Flavobacterium shii]
MPNKKLIQKLGFLPKENASDIFVKKYADNYCIEIDFGKNVFHFGGKIKIQGKETQNISKPEDWVVLECVNKFLEKGYKPENISLEKVYPAGHGFSGRLDICVTRDDGSEYLLIECKTYGKEFEKEFTRLKKDGGQLFTYFKFSNKADVIMLYASELKGNEIVSRSEIVKIEDDYRSGDVKDFYEKWNKLTKDNGVFDSWVKPYNFESKALSINDLEEIRQEDSSFIFNRFLEILRHNVVSDKGNAFNRIFTLFLCKIYDEKSNEGTDNELGFQWLEGIDNHRSFQIRLTDLYKNGMHEFLEKVVTDFSETEFKNRFPFLNDEQREPILEEFRKIRLEKNNEFAIKDVYDEQSFNENAIVVKEIVELLQKYKLRYTKKQQYLSDFFELLLTTGLKQESGQFFTPVPVAQFVIKSLPIDTILENKLASAKIDNDTLLPYVMDYAAGSGHFLTETMHEMQRLLDKKDDKKYHPSVAKKIRNWKDDHFAWAIQYVYGIEKDYRLVKVGKVGCYLHGDGLANVIHSDGLANFSHPDYKGKLLNKDKDFPQDNKQFDIIVSNPPYSVSAFKNTARSFYKDNDFELYNKLTDNSSEIECLFIERTKQLLKDGGVAGIILPSSILSNTGIYSRSRELILQYFDIIGITELGSSTFMATNTSTVTLFLRRRNNYESANLKIAVEKFFSVLQDVTLNGIEKPVTKYVDHVWEGISFEDYISLLKKEPNKAIEEHEIYNEYKKKLKVKNDKEFWNLLLEKEADKLYYFLIVYSQKVVIVKSNKGLAKIKTEKKKEKEDEKRFLGYEFSNRRGSEGIHPMQRGKNIEDYTQLFDPEVFNNPKKASTYIYKAFQGDFDFPIDEVLQKNISRHNLVDMITFDRVDFEKNISLSVKKKVSIESKWELVRIKDISLEIINGSTPPKNEYNFWDKKEINWLTIPDLSFNKLDVSKTENYVSNFALENKKVRIIPKNSVLISCTATIGRVGINSIELTTNQQINSIICNENILPYYLANILKIQSKSLEELTSNSGVKHVNLQMLNNFKIPLPPKNIQQKIVDEIKFLENKETETIKKTLELRKEIRSVLININGEQKKLRSICKYSETRINSTLLTSETYVGVDNLLQDMVGKVNSNFLPDSGTLTEYKIGDVLLSNIRPYLKKIWFADNNGGSSNDVLVLQKTDEDVDSRYIYYILRQDEFFDYEMLKPKGLKMPRGDKQHIMDYIIPIPPLSEQQKIVSEIEKIEKKIKILEKEMTEIPKQKEAVLKKYL